MMTMLRHILLTSIIVAAVYLLLLWVNQDGLLQQPVWAADQGDTAVEQTRPEQQEDLQGSTVETESVATFESITITGVLADIDLNDPVLSRSQVESAWQRFSEHQGLHRAVSWSTGSNIAYAYYHHFSNDFSTARLIIGYQISTTGSGLHTIQSESGNYRLYQLGASAELPDDAWTSAYPDGVILERHRIDSNGSVSASDALVIQ